MCGIVFAASTNVAVIVVAGFLLTAVSNIFSNGVPHLPGGDLPDRDPQHRQRRLLLAVPRDLDRLPFIAVPALAALGPVAVFSGSAALIVLLCLDVGLLGPLSTGLSSNRSNRGRAADLRV